MKINSDYTLSSVAEATQNLNFKLWKKEVDYDGTENNLYVIQNFFENLPHFHPKELIL